MMTRSRLAILLLCAAGAGAPAQAQSNAADLLSFPARAASGAPAGWNGSPVATLSTDSVVRRSAPYAGVIDRTSPPEGEFSALNVAIPVEFTGRVVELRGWLRTEGVVGDAGLWLRIDGPGGSLQFDNMAGRGPKGTTEWTEYRIRLPLGASAERLVLGALLAGTGKLWVDDLQVLVDGQPFTAAPRRVRQVLAGDSAFDAGSGIANQPLSAIQTANLALLGRVWGFVKYHHPRVTAGQVHWDYELLRVMPAVLQAADRTVAEEAITAWLGRLGDPEACSPCASAPVEAHLPPSLALLEDPALTDALRSRLETIYRNRSTAATQHYRGVVAGVGNPDFSNESDYASQGALPDAGFRLLGLFRFWNIIEYWFPYRDIIGEDWNAVLAEFIPDVMAADDAAAWRLVMIRLSARIHDTHANVWRALSVRPPTGNARLPVAVRFVEGKAVVTGYTHPELGPASGLLRGDVIERIDGAAVDSLVAAWRPFYSASNEPTRLRDIARSLPIGSAGAAVLTISRDGRTFEQTANRVSTGQLDPSGGGGVHDLPGETFRMLTEDVAYLKLSSVTNAALPGYLERAAEARVLVVDIRNYPSEFVVFSLGGRLVRERTEFARFTAGDPANPGAFLWGATVAVQPIEPGFAGRVVILVDETSQSQAEYTAMALRAAPGAIVVGSTTAGADGNVSAIPLPGGISSMISGIGVFYPDGAPTQRIGIIPDLEVRPTIAGIRAGRDEVLEAGVSRALGREFRLPPR